MNVISLYVSTVCGKHTNLPLLDICDASLAANLNIEKSTVFVCEQKPAVKVIKTKVR